MSRWNIWQRDNAHDAEPKTPNEVRPQKRQVAAISIGRCPAEAPETATPERSERPVTPERDIEARSTNRRTKHQSGDRAYSLRSSEIAAMTDIGKFRTIDVRDLAQFVYDGNHARLKYDLESLRAQGLVEEKTLLRAHRSARKLVTLTAEGKRVVREASDIPKAQRVYYGFVKPKELDHDTDLYKVYQRAAEEIRAKGGRPTRVRLDFELKESINRTKEAAGRLPEDERKRLLTEVAREQGLTIHGTSIHLPDIQVEYQTRDGGVGRQNLELLSRNYREDGIRGKAAAGFKIYARSGDTNRIRRALHDTGMVREVLSV
jgi:DNA-binding PadR family transcriptional regulator